MLMSPLERLRRFDDERSSLPGEHWMTLGMGLWLMTRPATTVVGRLAAVAAGAALVLRAASGRDGFAARLGWDGLSGGSHDRRFTQPRRIDLSSPWPQPQRVRVPAISQPVGRPLGTP